MSGPRLRPVVRKRGEKGFSLILLTVSLVVMLGMLGLAVDAGRMFIVKNELQTFVDASAMAAVGHLDGTAAGVQTANSMATAGPMGSTQPNGYNFGTSTVSTVMNTYATAFNGTFDSYATANGLGSNHYRFIKVTASANVALNFLPVIPGISTSATLSASATAGQNPQSSVGNGGLLPFAPDAHNQADHQNFGFTLGSQYTLKWGNGNTTTCAGDLTPSVFTPPGNPPSEHGFIDIGTGNSDSNIRTAIKWGGYPNPGSNPSSIATGDTLGGVPGNRGTNIFDSLQARAQQDTNDTATTYAQYVASGTGNGRRIVTVAVAGTWSGNGANAGTPNLGFANFLLLPSYSGTNGPICAIYIGPGNLTGTTSAAADGTQVYTNMLYQ
jgi:Flp pilus assembly protein TadG